MTEDHVYSPWHDWFVDAPYVVVPQCSCGWEGRNMPSGGDALESWENHCEQVFMAATEKEVSANDPD